MKTIFFDVDVAANIEGFAENILEPLQHDQELMICFFSISKREIVEERLRQNGVDTNQFIVYGYEDH